MEQQLFSFTKQAERVAGEVRSRWRQLCRSQYWLCSPADTPQKAGLIRRRWSGWQTLSFPDKSILSIAGMDDNLCTPHPQDDELADYGDTR